MRRIRPASFGAEPAGARLARILKSPNYDPEAGAFRNPVPAGIGPQPGGGSRGEMFRALLRRDGRKPAAPIPVQRPDLSAPPADGLRLTWLGHATVLAEIDGRRVLFDPVFGERCSPFSFAGPRRFHRVPLPLGELGPLDAVVISHDHYDHLDMSTVRELRKAVAPDVLFAVPLGVGAHLERWGVPRDRIAELDWNESTGAAGLTLTATPARHFCGRGIRNKQRTLWASWSVRGPEHRVFHSGDTGYFPGFAEIGADHGPFDAAMVQIGAYSEYWPDIHMTPEEGVRAHLDLRGGVLLPIHWGTFNLAPHRWEEPAERTAAAAAAADVRAAIPRPGEPFEPSAQTLPTTPWWQEIAAPERTPQARGGRKAAAKPSPATEQ
ncbi:metallo-beta-lactamase [Streptomyces sp. CNQ-509]|uniref:MBL fold metallo-hydrolase n=1 Tax=Streptomyces sp. CNQ-509 TaxID=444103 RepID=UPI00062E0AF3|nr:MBL fold metallo-hydrolase [Streptomyces sp. CNQ-509]AKH82365.1 metallo-beta-lactamase [Streptomyces sp. CNQ-509]